MSGPSKGSQQSGKPSVRFEVCGGEPSENLYRSCRRMIVGPWLNQPEHYEGYNGFVGWTGITRLKSGRWLLTFTSGSWHATVPWTEDIRNDPACRRQFEEWKKIGLPNIWAPRGGRAHIMHSDDEGRSWSKPETLIDTEYDDRHPTILELNDGTLLCTFFTYALPGQAASWYMRSTDGGENWSELEALPGESFGGFGNGSAIQLSDGTVLCSVGGKVKEDGEHQSLNICRSRDSGKSFEVASVIEGVSGSSESPIAELPDGRIVLISRRSGPIYWSEDGGDSWSEPQTFGVEIYDPHFVVVPSGVLACFHGSYNGRGLRVILSADGGLRWRGPKEAVGYAVDPSVYGYSHAMVLPDGTVYVVYLHTGGHRPHDARTEAIWGLRVKVNEGADGIEILPAPGSPAETGGVVHDPGASDFSGGDPELGNRV